MRPRRHEAEHRGHDEPVDAVHHLGQSLRASRRPGSSVVVVGRGKKDPDSRTATRKLKHLAIAALHRGILLVQDVCIAQREGERERGLDGRRRRRGARRGSIFGRVAAFAHVSLRRRAANEGISPRPGR